MKASLIPFTYVVSKTSPNVVYRVEPTNNSGYELVTYSAPCSEYSTRKPMNVGADSEVVTYNIKGCSVWIKTDRGVRRSKIDDVFRDPIVGKQFVKTIEQENFPLEDCLVLSRDCRSTEFDWSSQLSGLYYGHTKPPKSKWPHLARQLRNWLDYYHKVLIKAATTSPILSTDFDCLPHQIRVAEQIFQRRREHKNWLLADDIGTGKTVTSILLMQRISNQNRESTFTVLVPTHLISHWSEHITKTNLENVDIVDHAEFESVSDQERSLVVIDEAHLLVSKYPRRLNQLRMDQCRNVLYLTATPATRSNNSYLLLLHLIDPTKYPQENESIALDNVIKLRGKVAEYRKLYQSDPQSVNSSKLRDELVRAGIVPENAVGKNRLSLTELVPISDFLFEHYRYSALVASNNQPTRFFKRRVEFTSSKTRFELLGELLSRDKSMSLDQIETYTKSLQSFRQMFKSVTGKDIDIKSRAQMELDETAKKDALCEYIINETTKNKHYSAVVFADSAPECSALSDYLLTKLPYLAVSSIYDCTEHCQILILDRENETGLSLTKYDEVIFYDIPMDVNRIDQRIGRLDRFGRNFLTPVVIMVPTYSYEYLKYEKTNSTEKSRAVTLKYADPFIDNILSLLHRGLGDISGRPLLHASDEVAKRKRFSIFDWSLNFVSHENEELLSNVLRLVQHSIEGEAYPMYKIEKSSKYADQTVIINSFLSIPSIKEYVRSWNDEANLGLQRITSESKIDQDSMSIANQLRIHQDWLKKISLFMVEWNESCPFNDYKFNTRIIGSNNLTELEEEIIRMLNIYDFN